MKNEPWLKTEEGIYLQINLRLSTIQNFLNDVRKALDKYVQSELTEIGDDVDNGEYPKEYPKEYLLENFGEAIYNDMLPYLSLSFVMLISSEFEKSIKQVCSKLKERLKLETDLDDFKRKKGIGLIKGARKYLTDHGKFKNPDIKSWESIEDIYLIRNIIVHNELVYEKLRNNQKEAVNRFDKKNCGIKIYTDPFADILPNNENRQAEPTRILIDWNFCEYCIKETITFFEKLQTEHLKRLFGSLRLVSDKQD